MGEELSPGHQRCRGSDTHPNSRNNSYLGLGAQTNFFSFRFSFSVVFCYCNRKETKIRVICRGVGTLLGLHH